jgi:HEPN domain-containing protein
MSWGFKALDAMTEPSVTAFATIDRDHPGLLRPTELRDYYADAEALALPASVPGNVSDYFDAARMLWTYGWYYYPFYSLAALHGTLCVELALKERFRQEGETISRRGNSLKSMLSQASQRHWIVPEGFSAIRRRKESEDYWGPIEADFEESELAGTPNREEQAARLQAGMHRLLKTIRYFRNIRAHPKGLSLRLPGSAYTELEFVRDLIAQLFK